MQRCASSLLPSPAQVTTHGVRVHQQCPIASSSMTELQRPESLYHAPERYAKQSSKEASTRPSLSGSNPTTIPFTLNAQASRPASDFSSTGATVHPGTDSESSIGDELVKTELEASVFHMILYLSFAVPGLAIISFFYTIITTPFLIMSKLCAGAAVQRSVLAGHQKLFRPHTRMLHIQPPEYTKDIIAMGVGTLPVSILVLFSGVFVVLGQVYSLLLSEHDRDNRSLNRVVSFWYSWLYLFSSETHPERTDDIV